jgi:thiol-disulfide isomerase/thioredoxin
MDRKCASFAIALGRRRMLGAMLGGTASAWLGLAAPARAADGQGHVVRPWPRERPVPRLGLADLDGRSWELSALKGRPVLLNFWATWCEPCRAEMPSLDRLARRQAGEGLAVFAVNYQEGEARIREFLDAVHVSLPVLLDRDGVAARQWTPRVFPSTVLIDRSGQPLSTVIGEFDWGGAEAAALLGPLLAKTA